MNVKKVVFVYFRYYLPILGVFLVRTKAQQLGARKWAWTELKKLCRKMVWFAMICWVMLAILAINMQHSYSHQHFLTILFSFLETKIAYVVDTIRGVSWLITLFLSIDVVEHSRFRKMQKTYRLTTFLALKAANISFITHWIIKNHVISLNGFLSSFYWHTLFCNSRNFIFLTRNIASIVTYVTMKPKL